MRDLCPPPTGSTHSLTGRWRRGWGNCILDFVPASNLRTSLDKSDHDSCRQQHGCQHVARLDFSSYEWEMIYRRKDACRAEPEIDIVDLLQPFISPPFRKFHREAPSH